MHGVDRKKESGRSANLKHTRDSHSLEMSSWLSLLDREPDSIFSASTREEVKWTAAWNVVGYHCLSAVMDTLTLLSHKGRDLLEGDMKDLMFMAAEKDGAGPFFN